MPRASVFVLDSTPLIALARAGALDVVCRIEARFLVPPTVADEVVEGGRRIGAPDVAAVVERIEDGTIEIVSVKKTEAVARLAENPRLSPADSECLGLAAERNAVLVADEKDLRAAASALGVEVGGSLSLLAMGVKAGIIDGAGAVAVAERMVRQGWYCSPSLLKAFADLMLTE